MAKFNAKWILILISLIMLVPSAASYAQWDFIVWGSLLTGGNPHDVYVSNNYAFLGDWGAGFSVVDVSYPWNPNKIYSYDTQGLSNSVFVYGNLALVADWSHGVSIFDITDPTAPSFLSSWDSPGVTYYAYVSGIHAFIADFYGGVAILDISDPSQPNYLDTQYLDGLATGICGRGNFVYVADFPTGIITFDISDPGRPQVADVYASSGDAYNITIDGNYLFLATGVSGVEILSIEDPANPSFLVDVPTIGYVNDIAVSDTLMFTAEDSAGASVYSIANMISPYLIDSCDTPHRAKGIFASGRTAYVGDAGSFLVLLLDDGTTGVEGGQLHPPAAFGLESVYPNPFNPEAAIEFSLAERAAVTLDVYDLLGEKVDCVADREFEAGAHILRWDGDGFPSGVYFFKLTIAGNSQTIKATLLK